jgi:hypothetical protein
LLRLVARSPTKPSLGPTAKPVRRCRLIRNAGSDAEKLRGPCRTQLTVAAIERMRDPGATPFTKPREALARAKARIRQAEHAYEQLLAAKAKNAAINSKDRHPEPSPTNNLVTGNGSSSNPIREPKPIAVRDEFDAMRLALPDLKRLERYERRAWSRRKRAIRDFIEIKFPTRPK